MKRMMLNLILASFFLASAGHAGLLDSLVRMTPRQAGVKVDTVKILIAHSEPGATISVDGKYKLIDPNTKKLLSTRAVGKSKYMQAAPDGLKWAEEFPGIYQLQIVPVKTSGKLAVNDVEYKGSLYVYNVEGKISIVNETTVEDFVAALLSAQVHDQMEEETLNALAIATRTQALYQADHPRNDFWSIDGRELGFNGFQPVNPAGPVVKAVNDTRNLAMTVGQAGATHFPASWEKAEKPQKETIPSVFARITLNQANDLARQGVDAPDILSKAFPGARLQLR